MIKVDLEHNTLTLISEQEVVVTGYDDNFKTLTVFFSSSVEASFPVLEGTWSEIDDAIGRKCILTPHGRIQTRNTNLKGVVHGN